ncbi:hypothetical protein LCGC14_3088130 [marine sediment metagenome]|uniref:Uncharacterized protein n=1 Tax=marine sediment metagenome TaxID=412755 RepID=A0A0F8Z1T4_9ZZZZ
MTKIKQDKEARIKELEEKRRTFHKIPNCDGMKAGLTYEEEIELYDLKREVVK